MAAKKKQEPVHTLTLDEYDELTADNQKLGAATERRDIISHLADVRAQIRGVAEMTDRPNLTRDLVYLEDGINAAVNAIKALPDLYARVGCEHCDGWD